MKVRIILTVFILCSLIGCGAQKTIDAELVGPSMLDVIQVHDEYVNGDTYLSNEKRAIYLTNSELVRMAIEAAMTEGANDAP